MAPSQISQILRALGETDKPPSELGERLRSVGFAPRIVGPIRAAAKSSRHRI